MHRTPLIYPQGQMWWEHHLCEKYTKKEKEEEKEENPDEKINVQGSLQKSRKFFEMLCQKCLYKATEYSALGIFVLIQILFLLLIWFWDERMNISLKMRIIITLLDLVAIIWTTGLVRARRSSYKKDISA